jgi:indole-3-glycerol phosphate synthase
VPTSERDIIERLRRSYLDTHGEAGAADRMRDRLAEAPPLRSLAEALSEDTLALIVEPKRAIAKKGIVNPNLDVAAVARECESAGATALSIVTEAALSQGSTTDLVVARSSCELPLLARDFVVHVAQVSELRAVGADALLIPMVAFDEDDLEGDTDLDAIVDAAHRLSMDVVLSVRSEDELEAALETEVEVLNIDNRDEDGRIDVERTFDLLAAVPVGKTVISESVASVDEVAKLQRAGVDALLLDEGHAETGLANALAVFNDLTLD